MPLPDTMYCSQQILLPPELPDILKSFTKAAIRVQPQDLLLWSAAYFDALSKGEYFPLKEQLDEQLEYISSKTDTGLTPGLLMSLHKQLSHRTTCSQEELQKEWTDLCLPSEQLENMLMLSGCGLESSEIFWMDFFALGCSALGGTLRSSLKVACEILTDDDDEDGAASIPFDTFLNIYNYLAALDGDLTQEDKDTFLNSLQPIVEQQGGMIKPQDFMNAATGLERLPSL